VLFVILGVIIIACIAEPNVEYPLPELETRFVRTRAWLMRDEVDGTVD
jgi:hypothetical protein